MRVAVVGAGLSGLGAALALREAGWTVTVYEKSRGLGGRLATRRVGGTVVDHGAPVLDAPPGSALAALAGGAGAVPVGAPVAGAAPPDAPIGSPVTFPEGLTRLAKHAAEDLHVVRGVRVAAVRRGAGGLELGDEQGNGLGEFDAVIVSAPAPQAADLLERSPEPAGRAAALRRAAYHPAVMVLTGLPGTAPAWAVAHPADGTLAAVAVAPAAGRPHAGDAVAVVARLAPAASADALDALSDAEILAGALPRVAAVTGLEGPPGWSQVKRWRFATVARPADDAEVNPAGIRIVVCGDAVAGPGMAAVYDSGALAARRVREALGA